MPRITEISPEGVQLQAERIVNEGLLGEAQAAIYAMIGGGFLGRFAIEQPTEFYIDDRVGKLPYKQNEIVQAVRIYARACEIAKALDDRKILLPEHDFLRGLPNLGVF